MTFKKTQKLFCVQKCFFVRSFFEFMLSKNGNTCRNQSVNCDALGMAFRAFFINRDAFLSRQICNLASKSMRI